MICTVEFFVEAGRRGRLAGWLVRELCVYSLRTDEGSVRRALMGSVPRPERTA